MSLNESTVNEEIINKSDIQCRASLDKRKAFSGQINNKFLFTVILIMFAAGYENFLNFPILVNKHGGIVFMILYLFVSIFVAMPIFLLEIGLGQFYSQTAMTVFNLVPILRGIGMSALIFCILILIPFCNYISWSFLYMAYSIFTDMPWKYCRTKYQHIKCVTNHVNSSFENSSLIYITSGELFFQINIQGIRNYETGNLYTFQNALTSINYIHFISFVVIWIFIAGSSWIFINIYEKCIFIYFFVVIAFMVILFGRTVFLPGSLSGLKEYFYPPEKHSISLNSLTDALIHCIYSCGVGTSIIISISSINKFELDFYKSSYLIIIGDFLFSFVAGIIQFSVIGYMAHENKSNITEQFRDNLNLNSFIDSVNTLGDSRFLCIFYTFILLNLSICSVAIVQMAIVLSVIEYYPLYFKFSHMRKLLFLSIICGIQFILCNFYSLNGSQLYEKVFNLYIESFAVPLVILLEIIAVHFIYGTKSFRNDMKMILGHHYNFVWIVSSNIILPFSMFLLICYSLYLSSKTTIPVWTRIISYFVVFVTLIPIFAFGFIEYVKYSKIFTRTELLRILCRQPLIMGPYYKRNWTINKYYQKKLKSLQHDPSFLKTVCEIEDVQLIIKDLNKNEEEIQIDRKVPKKKFENLNQPFNFSL